MKKILFILSILFVSGIQAQMTVTKHDGTPITNGQVLNFNTFGNPAADLGFYVHNNSASNISVRIRCESITNTDGTGMELCFGGVCLSAVQASRSYPSSAVVIPANGTNAAFDHFYKTNQGGASNVTMDYVFKFYQLDGSGNEVGNAITFTYRYDPTLGVEDFSSFNQMKNLGVTLKSNLINNSLEIEASKNVKMEIYDLNGRLVSNHSLASGNQSIDASNLNSSIYILNFTNDEGQKASTRIIKR
jgi:hypothetical protein